MIIGLTGQMGCGKGEIVNILTGKGFKHITLSSMIREEARKRGLKEEREVLMEIGNEMRSIEGAGVLARRVVDKINEDGSENWVIDGIRNPAEIEELRKKDDVHIVGVVAQREILVQRIIDRARGDDAPSQSEIERKLDREWGLNEPEDGQQVGKCMAEIDAAIKNEGSLKDLNEFVERLLTVLK